MALILFNICFYLYWIYTSCVYYITLLYLELCYCNNIILLTGNLWYVGSVFLQQASRFCRRARKKYICKNGWKQWWAVDARRISERLSSGWRVIQDACTIMKINNLSSLPSIPIFSLPNLFIFCYFLLTNWKYFYSYLNVLLNKDKLCI